MKLTEEIVYRALLWIWGRNYYNLNKVYKRQAVDPSVSLDELHDATLCAGYNNGRESVRYYVKKLEKQGKAAYHGSGAKPIHPMRTLLVAKRQAEIEESKEKEQKIIEEAMDIWNAEELVRDGTITAYETSVSISLPMHTFKLVMALVRRANKNDYPERS